MLSDIPGSARRSCSAGVVTNFVTGALTHLELGRAYAMAEYAKLP